MDKEVALMAEVPPTREIHPEDADDEWLTAVNTGRSFRVRLVTGALVILLVLGGGFWGGVVAEKHHGSGSTSSALASRLAALRAGATGSAGTGTGSGTGTGAGATGAATTGTVIDVQGDVVDISDSSGNIVKVTIGPSTTVTRTAKSSASGLQVGDTVVVTGSSGSGGSVNATAVRASAQGVTAGGFGGRGGFAGGSGAGGG